MQLKKFERRPAIYVCLFIIIVLFACQVFEPEVKYGQLTIQFQTEQQMNTLAKAAESLMSVQCILKKGNETINDDTYTKTGNSFYVTIEKLEPGEYSVLVYGYTSDGDILGRGSKNIITVEAGKTTEVSVSWVPARFQPSLLTPDDGLVISKNTLDFEWSDVSGTENYELWVASTRKFSNSVMHRDDLTNFSYTLANDLDEGEYYWKVRCKDSQGNRGAWSETYNFTFANAVIVPFVAFGSPGKSLSSSLLKLS